MTAKKKLTILFSHGSSNEQWKKEMENLCLPSTDLATNIRTAYMELCSPTLEDIIIEEDPEAIEEIKVLPIFLATGKHLRIDIPAQIERLSKKYRLSINLLPPIGEDPRLADAIKTITAAHLSQ